MIHSREELFALFDRMSKDDRQEMMEMFQNIPDAIATRFYVKEYKKEEAIIHVGDVSDNAYLILEGRVYCEDIQLLGRAYKFTEYHPAEICGDFEIIDNIERYRTSIYAAEPTTILVMPAAVYLRWIRSDVKALFSRTKAFTNTLANESFFERKYIFLSSHDKLLIYLFTYYKERRGENYYILTNTQAEIAERVGVNVRTLQRTIKTLEAEGYVTVRKGKVCVSKEQYRKITDNIREYL